MKEIKFTIADLRIGEKTAAGEDDFLFSDSPHPEISWRLESKDPDCRQTAYRIIAADLRDEIIWDSGKVMSPQLHWIPWGGRELRARELVRLQVKVWCGKSWAYSDPVAFEPALQKNSDWGDARWIWFDRIAYTTTPLSPYFRREFTVRTAVKRAVLYITARGVFEPRLDGCQIGHDLLAPGWVDSVRRSLSYVMILPWH